MTYIPWCEIAKAVEALLMRIVHLIFFLLRVKLVSLQCFQNSQKPEICNLVSLLYSHLRFSACGVWNGNRRAKITPFMVICGLWSMIYTSEMLRLLQTKYWRERGQHKALDAELAQARSCDTVGKGDGEGVCICKIQFYILISALNFEITSRKGFISCLNLCVFLFHSLLVFWINVTHQVVLLRSFLFLLPC